MVNNLKAAPAGRGSAYRLAHTLPRTLYDALHRFTASKPIRELLGQDFIDVVELVKNEELSAFQHVISSWGARASPAERLSVRPPNDC